MGSQTSKPVAPLDISKRDSVIQEKAPIADYASGDKIDKADPAVLLDEALTLSALSSWESNLEQDPSLALSRLVLHSHDPVTAFTSRRSLVHDEKVFNLQLKGLGPKGEYPGPRVNQASSGRCWLFATTNVIRYNVVEKLNLGEFQLSQSYLFFYDKLEKANYYLESMIDLKDETIDSRIISFLNQSPVGDGGQWDMAVNVLEKYGMIPQPLFPESFSSSSSARLNQLLTSKLREYGLKLRAASSPSHARKLKSEYMKEVYNTLSITLGSPPRPDDEVSWDYYDKDNKYHQWKGTPKDFYDQFGKRKNMDPKDSFSLINDPRNDYETLYTVERLGNVKNGKPVRYVNAPIEALEDAVIAGLKANTPLFFGCDVGKSSDRLTGTLDTKLFDYRAAYGFDLSLTKSQRLQTGESSMTHAMVITAVHLDDAGRPVKYKIENSWSDQAGEGGWFMMTGDWFREFVYQVVIPRSVADKKWVKVLDEGEAVVLKPWDPMGALA